MKQKVVIKLSMSNHKSRAKALKIAVGQQGVESVAIKGQENNQLEVVGQVDAVVLATLLRKCLGKAELVSVGAAGAGDKNANKAETPAAQVQHGYIYPSYSQYAVAYDPSAYHYMY
ncbi:PREDICTED: uncharacterized protein LOC109155771 [Ipomoea nil]|uniref:uncharacterized protein LOC109155771 n=1 Tax=Ipomoea nil TaxID=35883 RepID=UPI000900F07F|nr:PREDICTED: uncharacterized protein LOC109155771 [Ipomoea nil]